MKSSLELSQRWVADCLPKKSIGIIDLRIWLLNFSKDVIYINFVSNCHYKLNSFIVSLNKEKKNKTRVYRIGSGTCQGKFQHRKLEEK